MADDISIKTQKLNKIIAKIKNKHSTQKEQLQVVRAKPVAGEAGDKVMAVKVGDKVTSFQSSPEAQESGTADAVAHMVGLGKAPKTAVNSVVEDMEKAWQVPGMVPPKKKPDAEAVKRLARLSKACGDALAKGAKWESCVKQVKEDFPKDSKAPYAICTSSVGMDKSISAPAMESGEYKGEPLQPEHHLRLHKEYKDMAHQALRQKQLLKAKIYMGKSKMHLEHYHAGKANELPMAKAEEQAPQAEWHAQYKGKFYPVKDIRDSGKSIKESGGGNYYHLEGVEHPVHQSEIEDMVHASDLPNYKG